MIADAAWGDLDYFLIDLPPGTSDIHLTVVQTLAMTGAIVVSTPQAVALADARKGINMFTNDKVNVPILGLVENMAWFTPAELPENKYYIFGKEGAKKLAEELNTNTRYISAVVNIRFHQNYSSLVNEYRIKDAQYLLTDKSYMDKTMEEISAMVGFANRQSFYAAFYKILGVTPRGYRMEHLAKEKEAAKA